MKTKNLISFALVAVLITCSVMQVRCDGLDPEHIRDGYEQNEPVFVHTPVISPVAIHDEDGNDIPNGGRGSTELVDENPAVSYQLRLDTSYIMHWESMTHRSIPGYGDSGENPSRYDRYTKDKWMKYPFEVLYEGKFYELQPDGYTEWIKIRKPPVWTQTHDNHWIDTPIYIPSYAREVGETGNTAKILFKVEAINVDGDLAQHYAEEERNGNLTYQLVPADDGAMYVATYDIDIQLSGWIYDFTITGTNNGSVYEGRSEVGSNDLSFVSSKSEKKAGIKNRLGEGVIRYLLDGHNTTIWDEKNTITLTDGKSKQFTKQGALWRGQTFSFEVKTMGNLYSDDGNEDRIEIIPTFTYVDNSGNKVDSEHLKVFYNNPDGSGRFIEYGSSRDTIGSNWSSSAIGSAMQEGAYYTFDMTDTENHGPAEEYHFGDWSTFTAFMYNKNHPGLSAADQVTSEKVLGRRVTSYCLSRIILNPKLRLLSGEWEQLSFNIKGAGLEYGDVFRYSDLDSDGVVDPTWTQDDDERFRNSMQTWYGEYYVPSELYVVDLNEHPGFDMESYMSGANGRMGIQEDDPVFEKSGYLIINFDIRAYNDGRAHLVYLGASADGNMWDIEAFRNTPLPGDPTPITSFEDGDVVVIDLEKSVKDKYSSGVHNIN